jgi:alpha-1,2-mannosyltransferase
VTGRTAAAPFNPERLRGYSRVVVAVYALVALGLFSGAFGKPLDDDFITYWSASYLSLEGRPLAAFDLAENDAAQRLAVPISSKIYPWHYPPTYQLLVLPLALLPYLPAYLSFIALSLIAYTAALRKLLDWPDATFLLLAYPGAFICFLHGQNSLFTAALFALALWALARKPLIAGICFGLLAYKPQLGLLIPLALLAAGQWSTFAAAAATVLGFAGIATAVFGFPLWRAFLQHTAMVRSIMEQDLVPWEKMPTAFVFFRWLGIPQDLAYAGQIMVAIAAAVVVFMAWRRRGPSLLAGAILVSASLIVWPYVFDYELAILAVPLAIVATDIAGRGAARWEPPVLLVLYCAPMLTTAVAKLTHLQVGFLEILAVLLFCVHRLVRTERQQHGPGPEMDTASRTVRQAI